MRLFISYAHEDQRAAAEIVEILDGSGHQAWWDRELLPGDDWLEGLKREIKACEAMVYIMSPPAVESTWCHWELGQAAALERPVFTVLLRECKIPEVVRRIQYADFRGGATEEAIAYLLAGLAKAERLPEAYARMVPEPVGPPAGLLPQGSRMPFSRNPLFTGREEDLEALDRALAGGTAVVGQVALTGMGGIGKTQLAAEYVFRYGHRYAGGVHWLSFADPAAVPAEVAANGRRMFGSERMDPLPFETQVEMVKQAWAGPESRLLIFDNLDGDEAEEVLVKWRPEMGGARLLVTSRRGEWEQGLGVEKVALRVLDRGESVALLRKYRPDLGRIPAEGLADELAGELGDLPLALDLAGSYLKRYERSVQPDEYLDTLRKPGLLEHKSMIGFRRSHSPTKHDLDVGRTFAISYERLQTKDALDQMARSLLFRAACFAPGEAIPWELLAKTAGDEEIESEDLEESLKRLAELGLVTEEEDGTIWMHRLVTAFVLSAAEEEGVASEVLTAVEEVVVREAERLNGEGYPGPLLAWQGHLRHVADGAAVERQDEMAGRLLNSLGYHLHMIADYAGAEDACRRALAIDEAAFGPGHPDVAIRVNNLGLVLKELGDYAGAREAFQRALMIFEKELGPEHPHVATLHNNLGLVLKELSDTAGAREAFRRALAIDEAAFGSHHPNVARDVNNLGGLLQALGEYEAAKQAYQRALAIDEATFGPHHPNVARDVNNLGGLLQALGEYEAARSYYEQALAIFEEALGPGHPNTQIVKGNLEALDG